MKRKISISSLSVKLVGSIVIFGCLMFSVNSFMSYKQFKHQVENLYGDITKQFAQTAVSYIDTDRISYWLKDGNEVFGIQQTRGSMS